MKKDKFNIWHTHLIQRTRQTASLIYSFRLGRLRSNAPVEKVGSALEKGQMDLGDANSKTTYVHLKAYWCLISGRIFPGSFLGVLIM